MLMQPATNKFINHLKLLNRSSETIIGYEKDLKACNKYWAKRNNAAVYVEDIKRDDIESFLYYLKEEKNLKPRSVARTQYTLRSFFKYLHGSNIVKSNPTAMLESVKIPQQEREFLTEDEVYKLKDAIKSKIIKVAVLFLFFTGLRISECCHLENSDVDLTQNLVRVRAGKGNKDRLVPINSTLHDILQEYVESIKPKVDTKRFFATKKTGILSPQYVNREIKEAIKSLGWEDKHISAHNLRHSYASALISKNVNIVHVSKLLGHSSVKVTSIYAHSDLSQLRKAVENL